jgi:hypothetical protein
MGRLLAGLGRRGGYTYYRHTNDPDAPLAYIHYSDPNFDEPGKPIYGAPRDGLTWYDSWSLHDGSAERSRACYEAVEDALGPPARNTARGREAYLEMMFGRPLRLVCIVGWADPDSGYGRCRYGVEFE